MRKYKFEIGMTLFFIMILWMLGYGLYSNMEKNLNVAAQIQEIGTEITTEQTIQETTQEITTEPVTQESTTKQETIQESTTEQTTQETTQTITNKKDLGLYDEKHEYVYIGDFKITGYSAEEGFSYGSATAWGSDGCRPGICAMNRFEMKELGISYGDYIYVKNLGEFQVTDCTADWITNVVDIWVYTNEEAYQLTGHYKIYKVVNS